MKKLIYLFLTVLIVGCNGDDGNSCLYNPTLTTSAVTNITEISATLNGVISIVSQNCDDPNNTEQGFVYATTIQPTIASTKVNVNGTEVTTTLENLEPITTYYVRTFLTNNLGEFYGNEVSFITSEEPCDVVYLADNGITIKACDDANVGDTGEINGVTYTVVDEAMLRDMVDNEEDVTNVVTTKVTNMFELFFIDINTPSALNQNISSWDVSNVTDMGFMFANATAFNQPIGNWDVSNVTDMKQMFYNAASFNQPIGDWDVSNVTNMQTMFYRVVAFNQPIENWDVSNVTTMQTMFHSAHIFNQPIGNWDVSNVTDMSGMFFYSDAFNQPIGNWDVRNVTDMLGMFFYSNSFNQPIGNWDVSNVAIMYVMFSDAVSFNQDLSSWSVNGVTDCYNFSDGATSWTLPQPSFTNCTP
jgi:surface protein